MLHVVLLLEQITTASHLWYAAIEQENVFFSTPVMNQDQKQFARVDNGIFTGLPWAQGNSPALSQCSLKGP